MNEDKYKRDVVGGNNRATKILDRIEDNHKVVNGLLFHNTGITIETVCSQK